MKLGALFLSSLMLAATLAGGARAQSADFLACTKDGDEPPLASRFDVCNRAAENDQLDRPDLARVLRIRGHASRLSGKIDEALIDYERAISLQPGHPSGYVSRGSTRLERLDYQGAFADGTRAVEADASDPDGHFLRGQASIRLGLWPQAEADLSRALNLVNMTHTSRAGMLLLRGYGRVQLNRLEEAVQDFSEAIRLKPDDAFSHRGRGIARLRQQSFELAAADFSRAIILKEAAEDYYNRGVALAYLSLPDRAFGDFDIALDKFKKDSPEHRQVEATTEAYRKAVAAERRRERDRSFGDRSPCGGSLAIRTASSVTPRWSLPVRFPSRRQGLGRRGWPCWRSQLRRPQGIAVSKAYLSA